MNKAYATQISVEWNVPAYGVGYVTNFLSILTTLTKAVIMSLTEYKESIKQLIDSTEDELLLRHWKKQLEWDVEHQNELELTDEEWNLVQEGLADYENGEVISLDEFINKRK